MQYIGCINLTTHTKGIKNMKLIRYSPSNINPYDEIDRWFESALTNFGRNPGLFNGILGGINRAEPALDFNEDAENYYARFELPGVKKGDIELNLERNVLTLKGDRKEKTGDGEQSYSFSRSIRVPEGIDAEKVSAKLQDGLLTVALPRAEASKARKISVK